MADIYALTRANWELFRRMARDYKAGRLTNHPPPPPGGIGGSGSTIFVGKTTEIIEKKRYGKIIRLRGTPKEELEEGEPPTEFSEGEGEQEAGQPFDAFNRFGQLGEGKIVLYANINGAWQIIQAVC